MSQQLARRTPGDTLRTISNRFVRTEVRGGKTRTSIAMPWLFLAIPLALLVTFTYVPVGNMIWYSFTSWDGLDQNK